MQVPQGCWSILGSLVIAFTWFLSFGLDQEWSNGWIPEDRSPGTMANELEPGQDWPWGWIYTISIHGTLTLHIKYFLKEMRALTVLIDCKRLYLLPSTTSTAACHPGYLLMSHSMECHLEGYPGEPVVRTTMDMSSGTWWGTNDLCWEIITRTSFSQETWMYPPILVFRPDLAKAMLGYRIQGIGEAKQRAAEGGYQGARYQVTILVMFWLAQSPHVHRFPWESAYTGAEVTPDLCVACRENQQHITGDIAWAARSLVGKKHETKFNLCWLQQNQNFSPDKRS